MAKKKLGADIPVDDLKSLYDFCARKGYVKGRAAVAAFRLFQWAPLHLRDRLMEGDENWVNDWFREADFLITKERVLKAGQAAKSPPKRRSSGKG